MDNLNNPTPSLETEKDREASSEDRLPDVSPEDIANILDRVTQLSAERQKKRQELTLQHAHFGHRDHSDRPIMSSEISGS
jgi:hypothetical protein